MSGIEFPRPRTLLLFTVWAMALFIIFVPDTPPLWLAIFLQSFRASVTFVVVIIYGWAVWRLLIANQPEPANGLVIGIFLAFGSDLYSSVQSLIWRGYGQPKDWTMQMFWQIPFLLAAIAAMHYVVLPSSISGKIPRRNLLWLAVGGVMSIMLTLVIIWSQASVRDYLP